jgi:NHL repeat
MSAHLRRPRRTRRHPWTAPTIVATTVALGSISLIPLPADAAAVVPPPGPTQPLVYGAAAGQNMDISVGVTHAAYSADPYENAAAVASARGLLGAEPVYQNQAIYGFGTGNPEPAPGVYDWSGLDRRMSTIASTGGIAVITLVGAPDWMKGGAVGATNYNDVPYAPSPSHYQDFANLAVQIARRYPFVHYFQIWNELKGFWDNVHSRWDYVQYTQMYNDVYDALKAYNPNLQVGGPYVTIESDASSSPAPAGSLTGPWGTVDPRSLQVLSYWLTHKHGADFISLDARATTTSGGQQADEFTSAEKFAAVDAWVRQRTALPIWWSEFYDQPPGTSWTPQHQDASLSAAISEMAVSGASVALLWSPEGDATDPTQRGYLWSYADVPGGGQPSPLYASFESFNADFSSEDDGGTPKTGVSVVVNPTSSDLAYGSTTLTPYQVAFVSGGTGTQNGPPAALGGTGAETPSAGPASTAKITTVAGGSGQGIAMHVAQTIDAVAVAGGNAYVADPVDDVVREVGLGPTPTQRVETVIAGDGVQGSAGDGGPATAAGLNDPEGIAVDHAGDVYIADAGNNRIRKVTPAGVITTVAGNGVSGNSGDGGPATSAHLAHPTGVALDAQGDLFIVDDGNNTIREVTPDGVITTVAGNGTAGYSGDGGPATRAQLDGPTGIAVDATGDLFIADGGNQRIREVTPNDTIQTVAGTGTQGYSGDGGPATAAQLNNPEGIAVDAEGDLWIVDRDNGRVREVNSGGTISSPIGCGLFLSSGDGGPGTSAEMDSPEGLAVDAQGDVYVSDSLDNRVRRITPAGVVTTVAGNGNYGFSGDGGPATSAELWDPQGLAVDSAGNLYIADFYNNRIRKVTPAGIISTVVGYGTYGFAGDGGGATKAWLEGPTAVAVDAKGDLFVADEGNDRIREVTPAWTEITTVAGDGIQGDTGDGGPGSTAEIDDPTGLAVNAAGDVFIADSVNNKIRELSPTGTITTFAGNGTAGFAGDGGPAADAELSSPTGVAVDAAGDVYVADTGNDRIREITPAGIITTVAGTGAIGFAGDGGPANYARLNAPGAVATGATPGLFWIADTDNNRIRKVQ